MEPVRASDAPSSRNNVFFESVHLPSPPKAKPPLKLDRKMLGPPRRPTELPAKRGHVKRPSFGRMSTEQRASEHERIRADDSVDIRVFLEREYKLGEGRNAEVYLGAYRDTHQPEVDWELCAVKRMQVDRESQLAGLDEAFALRRLGPHPRIVRLITVMDEMSVRAEGAEKYAPSATDLPRLLILLEHLPFTMATFVHREPYVVDLEQWMTWATQLASTVEWLHARGCVHGDIKMQNVLLTHDLQIKLCDFTSVLFSNAAVPATDCLTVGTPQFRAPELFTASRWTPREGEDDTHPALSYTLDIFSLGVLLYSLATGVEPSRRVRSVMAMRQRQALFFQSEEDDRIERMSIHDDDDPRSSPASLRGVERSPVRSASQMSDRSLRVAPVAIERLLDPSPLPHGVLSSAPHKPAADAAQVLRTKSLSATSRNGHGGSLTRCLSTSTHEPVLRTRMRPERTVSDTEHRIVGRARGVSQGSSRAPHAALLPPLELGSESLVSAMDSVVLQGDTPGTHSLLLQGDAPGTHSPRLQSDAPGTRSPLLQLPSDRRPTRLDDLHQPYPDGAPALILPGGGRLPDHIRALIQQMVSPYPEERPSAAQVLAALHPP